MFYRSVIPLVLFFMWNSKRPSSFTVNKSRGEIKYVSSPWFLLCYHWSSMQLIFESVWKPCTQAMHFFHPEANILEIYHWAKTQIISSHGYCSGGVCLCIYKNIYFHSPTKTQAKKHRHTHLIWAVIRTFPCSRLQGAMKTAICTSPHVVQHVCV